MSDDEAERLTLRLEGLAFGGDAVGRDGGGRVVFVAGGAPGDLAEVELVERKKSYARATLVRVFESRDRVEPPCLLAGECGGCPWQHVALPAQLAAKQEIVERALSRTDAEVLRIAAAPAPLGYRVRARMTARHGAVGFQVRRSHRVIDVEHCPALDPRLDAALQEARGALRPHLGDNGVIAGLVAPDGRVHLGIEGGFDAASETLADQADGLLGRAGIVGVDVRTGEVSRIYGEPLLDLGDGLKTSAHGFQQANEVQNRGLRQLVARWASQALPGPRILELYAGDGNFTRELVARGRVVAVEADRRAAARLVDNLRRVAPRGPEQHQRWSVRTESSATAVRRLHEAGERFDVVVLDPPRAGAADVVPHLAALEPERLVYVSCDPMTLARDLERLSQEGYQARLAQPVDMMPHTAHIEVVVLIERGLPPARRPRDDFDDESTTR
jgi:23S rRNA (uracil1939-C5)-methyltransferase